MKKIITLPGLLILCLATSSVFAGPSKDCMLEGTVHKTEGAGEDQVNVKFHSVEKYEQDSNCRVRKGEKMEFKLPEDTRLKAAPAGSAVKYRYQEDRDGRSTTELISVGTSST